METLIGIDIGGTTIKAGLTNSKGEILCQNHADTQTLKSVDAFLTQIEQQVIDLFQIAEVPSNTVKGIGVGAPGHILDSGVMVDAVNLPFRDPIPVAAYLSECFNTPAYLIKDSKAAALGEKYWGAGQKTDNFVLIMLGTGLGYAAYADGKIQNGHEGLAGELGHIVVQYQGRSCNCGKKGCLETYLSATGLKRTAFELMAQDNRPSPLRDYTFNQLETETIAQLAADGDQIAIHAFEITARYLGVQMANLTEQLSPSLFLLAGGLAKAGPLLTGPAWKVYEEHIEPIHRGRSRLEFSTLGSSEVGILGAAALVLEKQISLISIS